MTDHIEFEAPRSGISSAIKVRIFTDIGCPWCLIGLHRLDRIIARDFGAIQFDIDHRPIFLMPDLPVGGMRLDDYIREKFGMNDPAQAWAGAEREAAAAEIDFDHRRQLFAYLTDKAHTLIRLSQPSGKQHELAVALTDAYLLQGANIGDPEILADLASRHGMVREDALKAVQDPVELNRTRRSALAAASFGVSTIPHFIFGGTIQRNGNLSDNAMSALIAEAVAAAV